MLNEIEVATKILEHVKNLHTDFPDHIKSIYQTAVDYFGEDDVDLQFMYDGKQFYEKFLNTSLGEVARRFKVYELHDLECESGAPVLNVLRDEEKLNKFLQEVTLNRLLRTDEIPLYVILVRFRDFDVTNERDESTHIEEMFTSSLLTAAGKLKERMTWMRTKTSRLHYGAGYRHSHLNCDGHNTTYQRYSLPLTPCLGQGPIVMTTSALIRENNSALWALYWCEMDQCIRVESLAGGPYIKMATIKSGRMIKSTIYNLSDYEVDSHASLLPSYRKIIKTLIASGKLKWVWQKNSFKIANTLAEFALIISNCVIDIMTERCENLEEAKTLLEEKVTSGALMYGNFNEEGHLNELKREVVDPIRETDEVHPLNWSFKGEPVQFIIRPGGITREEIFYLLPPETISYIQKCLILTANNIYGRKNND